MADNTEFQREERYIVFKIADIGKAFAEGGSREIAIVLDRYKELARSIRKKAGKEPLTCVVVEKDWPIYEKVWQMIEAMAKGNELSKSSKTHYGQLIERLDQLQAENEEYKTRINELESGFSPLASSYAKIVKRKNEAIAQALPEIRAIHDKAQTHHEYTGGAEGNEGVIDEINIHAVTALNLLRNS